MIGFVLLLTLVMMTLAFRSVVVAVLSSALNLLSVGVAFGILTLVFQHGWFAGPLGFTSPGFVIDWIPLFVMVVLVGLSMDYNVFVLARIREHVGGGLPAAARGRARHHRHRRRDHERGGGDGLGVRHLHHPEHDRDEDDGRRAGRLDPDRRHR